MQREEIAPAGWRSCREGVTPESLGFGTIVRRRLAQCLTGGVEEEKTLR